MRILANHMMLAVAIFFALLQPFLHIHLDNDHPIQQTGLHIASEYEEANTHIINIDDHLLASTHHASEIISIDAAFKKDVDVNLSASTFAFALIVFSISVFIASASTSLLSFKTKLYRTYPRLLPALRAPPQS